MLSSFRRFGSNDSTSAVTLSEARKASHRITPRVAQEGRILIFHDKAFRGTLVSKGTLMTQDKNDQSNLGNQQSPGPLTNALASTSKEGADSILVESVLRLRMGGHEAHYAGNLVDGARVLQLFGDAATELLIRWDGDEGLFRAYESIEFLAPVYSGDYLEIRAKLVRSGRTSRTMEFEAWKVIQPLEKARGGRAVSSAEVLVVPLLVCKARGVCVTPLELQRIPHESGAK